MLSGILIVAKPVGPTSHDVVAIVRRLSATRRVGHGGTLDPFAAGVLPLFLGPATRIVEYHLSDTKSYRATICFGATSTTDDGTGELTPVDAPAPDRGAVERALQAFRGRVRQVPPDYSAVHIGGRRAYELARKGERPVIAERDVEIHALDLDAWDDTEPDRPVATVDVRCSAGTYVRAIARDIGRALGTGAYLGALSRTASGPFVLAAAHPLQEIRDRAGAGPAALEDLLLPADTGLEALPSVQLTESEVRDAVEGRFVRPAGGLPRIPAESDPEVAIRLYGPEGTFVGIAARIGPRLAPRKILIDRASLPAAAEDPG